MLVPHSEAFGNVFAEAIAAGLPVVGSAVGGVRDLVEPGVNGLLVPPDDPEATAAALARLTDIELREEMGRQSRAKAGEFLSWEAVARLYLSVYRQIVPLRDSAARRGDGCW